MNSWAFNVLIIISCVYFQDTDKLGKCSTYIDILLQHIRVTSVLLQTWDKFFPALPCYVSHMTFHFFVYCFYVQSTVSGKRYVLCSVFFPHISAHLVDVLHFYFMGDLIWYIFVTKLNNISIDMSNPSNCWYVSKELILCLRFLIYECHYILKAAQSIKKRSLYPWQPWKKLVWSKIS